MKNPKQLASKSKSVGSHIENKVYVFLSKHYKEQIAIQIPNLMNSSAYLTLELPFDISYMYSLNNLKITIFVV